MAFGHSCSIFHCITRFVLTTRDAISNANSFCTLQYPTEVFYCRHIVIEGPPIKSVLLPPLNEKFQPYPIYMWTPKCKIITEHRGISLSICMVPNLGIFFCISILLGVPCLHVIKRRLKLLIYRDLKTCKVRA